MWLFNNSSFLSFSPFNIGNDDDDYLVPEFNVRYETRVKNHPSMVLSIEIQSYPVSEICRERVPKTGDRSVGELPEFAYMYTFCLVILFM